MSAITIIKSSGDREPWIPGKLERSLRAAGATEGLIADILRHVERDLHDGMRTADIYRHAFSLLKRAHRPIAAQYSLKKAIMQLGPSGFPFERLVAHLLSAQGFQTKVGQIVNGMCITHEIDVIAEKDDERLIVEAKYHNDPATKSDVKVALYVHARFMDVEKRFETDHVADGKRDTFHRAWLITNTNFTSQAIDYGRCAGLAMTGWNYPKGRTLQDLVQETQTHPITTLTLLTMPQKSAIIAKGVVLCREIIEDPHILAEVGVPSQKIPAILAEARTLSVQRT
ncbi:MAG TPA: restriction endonuclease [Candidatus Paceibacterota bacterium]|nr:restriction endonuclease [Candidatus Paceibacterota bacterium]